MTGKNDRIGPCKMTKLLLLTYPNWHSLSNPLDKVPPPYSWGIRPGVKHPRDKNSVILLGPIWSFYKVLFGHFTRSYSVIFSVNWRILHLFHLKKSTINKS